MKLDIDDHNEFAKLKPNPNCPYGSYPIPDVAPSHQEIAKQMRVNADIVMQAITDHINQELERLKKEISDAIKEKVNQDISKKNYTLRFTEYELCDIKDALNLLQNARRMDTNYSALNKILNALFLAEGEEYAAEPEEKS